VLECTDDYLWRAAKNVQTINVRDRATICRELVKVIDNISEEAYAAVLQTVSILRVSGYADKSDAYQVARILELRGTQNSADILQHCDEIVKIWSGSKQRVTPADLLQFLRSYGGAKAAALSEDGFYRMAALIMEMKRQNGQ